MVIKVRIKRNPRPLTQVTMKHTYKLILTALTSCLILGIISCSNSADTTAKPMAANAKVENVTLALTGLTCIMTCSPKVQSALSDIQGVSLVSATKTKATVSLDRKQVTNAQLIQAVQSAGKGFNATVVKVN